MNQTDNNDPTYSLDRLERVAAPPFLKTRILAQVHQDYEQKASPALAYLVCAMLLLVFALNAYLFMGVDGNKSLEMKNAIQQTMNIVPQNTLYQ